MAPEMIAPGLQMLRSLVSPNWFIGSPLTVRMMPSPSRAFREVHGHEVASLDGALHLEPIVRLPSCCSPPKFGGHHDTCEDQFGEYGGHHHHQLGGLGSRKSKQGPDHPA